MCCLTQTCHPVSGRAPDLVGGPEKVYCLISWTFLKHAELTPMISVGEPEKEVKEGRFDMMFGAHCTGHVKIFYLRDGYPSLGYYILI